MTRTTTFDVPKVCFPKIYEPNSLFPKSILSKPLSHESVFQNMFSEKNYRILFCYMSIYYIYILYISCIYPVYPVYPVIGSCANPMQSYAILRIRWKHGPLARPWPMVHARARTHFWEWEMRTSGGCGSIRNGTLYRNSEGRGRKILPGG